MKIDLARSGGYPPGNSFGSKERVPLFGWKLTSHPLPNILLLIVCAIAGIGMFLVASERYDRFGASSFDLGIFQQAVWLISHGHPAFDTVRGMNILGDHWTPVIYFVAVLYKFIPSAKCIIAVQAVALALGCLPLYRLGTRHLDNAWLALALSVSYLCHPSLWGMAAFDFHPSSLAVSPLLAAVDAMDQRRWRTYFGWCGLALLCKEDIALSVLLLGVLAWIWGNRGIGYATMIGAILWLIVSMCSMAFLSHTPTSAYWDLYNGVLGDHAGAGTFILTFGHRAFSAPSIAYILLLLAPVAYLSLAAPEILLVGAPAVLSNVLSDRFIMHYVGFHYDAAPVAITYAAAAIGAARLMSLSARNCNSTRGTKFAMGILLVSAACLSAQRYAPSCVQRYFAQVVSIDEAYKREKLLSLIPPDASVIATNRTLPHLAERMRIFVFPNPALRVCWGSSPEALRQEMGQDITLETPELFERNLAVSGVDYVVLSASSWDHWPLLPPDYIDLTVAALACPSYGIRAVGGGLILLQKGAPFIPGLRRTGIAITSTTDFETVCALISSRVHNQR